MVAGLGWLFRISLIYSELSTFFLVRCWYFPRVFAWFFGVLILYCVGYQVVMCSTWNAFPLFRSPLCFPSLASAFLLLLAVVVVLLVVLPLAPVARRRCASVLVFAAPAASFSPLRPRRYAAVFPVRFSLFWFRRISLSGSRLPCGPAFRISVGASRRARFCVLLRGCQCRRPRCLSRCAGVRRRLVCRRWSRCLRCSFGGHAFRAGRFAFPVVGVRPRPRLPARCGPGTGRAVLVGFRLWQLVGVRRRRWLVGPGAGVFAGRHCAAALVWGVVGAWWWLVLFARFAPRRAFAFLVVM